MMSCNKKCNLCKNFLSGEFLNPSTWKCKAFPDGIPEMKIAFLSEDDCTDCNNGIGFEQTEQNQNKTA